MTTFLRVLDATDKGAALKEAIRGDATSAGRRFAVKPATFGLVPRSPFAYWVTDKLRQLFSSLDPLQHDARLVVSTNPMNDDVRFVRVWWEGARGTPGRRWRPWAKGGAFSPVYYDIDTVINWDETNATYTGFIGTASRQRINPVAGVQHFFRPGLTWPRRTNGLSVRVLPSGSVFADKGPGIFVGNDNLEELLSLVAIANSQAFALLVAMQLARTELAQSFEVGLLQRTPIPSLRDEDRALLAHAARRAWSIKRSMDQRVETSHAFVLPALLLLQRGGTLTERIAEWSAHAPAVRSGLDDVQAEIDAQCFDLYEINEADRGSVGAEIQVPVTGNEQPGDDFNDDADLVFDTGGAETLAAELVSWAAGVSLGRFDLRLATGMRPLPAEPEPFDPLPVCSPGMLTGEDGLPLAHAPPDYPLAFPADGAFVDDPGHPRDLTAAVRGVFEVVFGAAAGDRWDEAAALLDPKGRNLRAWLAKEFFEFHLKRYSKSRRKAPICWQLATPSSSYSVWLYAHRLTPDSLLHVQNELVAKKVDHAVSQRRSLAQDAGQNPTAKQRKELAAADALVEELSAMLAEVKRVAPLWKPDLDDGVVLTMAPLWRLVPQHKAWQKELQTAWKSLVDGEYDWAHGAMHLWPERVVPKCATDRSLAIAHGLEDEFWAQGADGKWAARPEPTRRVDALVRERTSAAVKAALKSLLEAPVAESRSRKPKRGSDA